MRVLWQGPPYTPSDSASQQSQCPTTMLPAPASTPQPEITYDISSEPAQPHPLLLPVLSPFGSAVLAYDVSSPPYSAKVLSANGGSYNVLSITPDILSSPALSSGAMTMRLFFNIPGAPRWLTLWRDVTSMVPLTLGMVLNEIHAVMQSAMSNDAWRALEPSPARQGMVNAIISRTIKCRELQASPRRENNDFGMGPIIWADALGGRTQFRGLTRADWDLAFIAEYYGNDPIKDVWVVNFG